ncbi:MAG: haloacid dehalogenase-like hydrolase [Dehalococcoidia bacterium]|jgi:phosphoglycolate phosphatase-like HAD superfamily hydrolase
MPAPKLLLFDVDGTLILTGGAGVRAMSLAFADLFGRENGLIGVELAGRIDMAILRAALVKHGIDAKGFPRIVERFRDAYVRHLAQTLPEAEGGRVLPGVREFLTALYGRSDVRLSLATGNFRRGAEMKLTHYGLWHFFDGGAFGEEVEERADLVAVAKRRLSADGQSAVYVFGDTVHDINAARANNAIAVAIASGFTGEDILRSAAPDFLFPDLSDWRAVLTALGL